jgi:hypothetical protein
LWYNMMYTLKAWDVLFNTQYNTLTIFCGGDRERDWFGQLKKSK